MTSLPTSSEYPRCPTCGHEFKALPRIDAMIAALGLTGNQKRVLTILAAGRGRYLTVKEIVHVLYDGREDGGPDDPETVVRQVIFGLRKRLQEYVQIIAGEGHPEGFRMLAIARTKSLYGPSGYQLVEARAAA